MQKYIKLNDGTSIPQFGLGVYMVPEGEQTYNAVLDALQWGSVTSTQLTLIRMREASAEL